MNHHCQCIHSHTCYHIQNTQYTIQYIAPHNTHMHTHTHAHTEECHDRNEEEDQIECPVFPCVVGEEPL